MPNMWKIIKNPSTKQLTGFPEKLMSESDISIQWAVPKFGFATIN